MSSRLVTGLFERYGKGRIARENQHDHEPWDQGGSCALCCCDPGYSENTVLVATEPNRNVHPKRDQAIAHWVNDGLLIGLDKHKGHDWLETQPGPIPGSIQPGRPLMVSSYTMVGRSARQQKTKLSGTTKMPICIRKLGRQRASHSPMK